MNKPVYLGFSIPRLSKIPMYEFQMDELPIHNHTFYKIKI